MRWGASVSALVTEPENAFLGTSLLSISPHYFQCNHVLSEYTTLTQRRPREVTHNVNFGADATIRVWDQILGPNRAQNNVSDVETVPFREHRVCSVDEGLI